MFRAPPPPKTSQFNKLWKRYQFKVGRSDLSMNRLGAAAGFAVLVVTLINQTAFGVADFPYGNYSVFFNVLDTAVILYVCFYNGWARNLILDRFRSAKEE